jgi:uncharacterized DUF497 family protein
MNRATVKGEIKTLDMTISMIKCTIRKYNEHAGIDIETRSMTSYHSTHTSTPAGYSSTTEHRRVAIVTTNYIALNKCLK